MRCANEGELCDRFATIAASNGWRVFPEVEGWDLVLFNGSVQVGIEAKMRCNIEVLAQAMRRSISFRHPDYCGILVPKASRDFIDICRFLRIVVFSLDTRIIQLNRRCDLKSERPLILPMVPIQTGGGRPSPRSLTPWRQNALRLCVLLRAQGYVSGKDFDNLELNRQNWLRKWVMRSGSIGRYARYVARPGVTLPDVGYETERDMIKCIDAKVSDGRKA